MLINVSNPILHFAKKNNLFDVGQNNLNQISCDNNTKACEYNFTSTGWKYFQEGKSMLAIHMDQGSSWHALEVATEGVEYLDFNAFQSASRSFSNGTTFTTAGHTINAYNPSTYINGTFSRLEASGSDGTLVSWSGKTMTVHKGGYCEYHFDTWTTSPSGCEGGPGVLTGGGINNPSQCNCTPDSWGNAGCGQNGCSFTQMSQTRQQSCGGPASQCVADLACGCTPSSWVNAGCGQNGCSATQMAQTRTQSCGGPTSQCVSDQTCTGTPTNPDCSTTFATNLELWGLAVGSTRACDITLDLTGVTGATLTYEAFDIDGVEEGTEKVNSSGETGIPTTANDQWGTTVSRTIPLSALVSGKNTVTFKFAANSGTQPAPWGSSGFSIRKVSLTVQSPLVISGFQDKNITDTSAMIVWNTNKVSDSQVEYGLTTSYGSSSPLDGNLVTSHSVVLSGLNSNTTYHYRAKSKDTAGNLTTSPDDTFTTTDTIAPVISNVVIGNITNNSATVTWSTDELSDSYVEFIRMGDGFATTFLDSTPNINHSLSAGGMLDENTTYTYRVKSKDAVGNIAISPDGTFSTLISVWPGDTDNNGVVDQDDVFPIGLYYGKTGPARLNASTTWVGQTVAPWSPVAATYADANGDGVVSDLDIDTVYFNFDQTHYLDP